MFHSHTWLSFCDAAPKLHASTLPWIGMAIAALLLVSYIAVEYGPEQTASGTQERPRGPHTSAADASAPAPCLAYDQRWYPAIAIGDLLAQH